MKPNSVEILAAALFVLAVLHTFFIKKFQHYAGLFSEDSFAANLFHLLGEVEIVFGWWAGLLIVGITLLKGAQQAIQYIEGVNFTEAIFVFVIMSVAGTRPIIGFANTLIRGVARILPLPPAVAFYSVALIAGPLLGSFITEPAAMTVTALIIRDRFFSQQTSDRFKYLTLAMLFVNVSIGGVLTPFAAPPVLMVASTWQWTTEYMLVHFGWKAVVASVVNTGLAVAICYRELSTLAGQNSTAPETSTPWWISTSHLVFLALVVLNLHHVPVFVGIFLFFLGFTTVTRQHQDDLNLSGSLLVAFFLSGLVVLGGLQSWWLAPLIRNLHPLPLFLGAAGLTAFTDNAALTYLGSQVPNVSEAFKYALVAGAAAGGGLTVIANAPNPAGFAILQGRFGREGISPGRLFRTALLPTIVALLCFWWLPHL
jgi:hypothetical protein